jgi:hypothetical protein
VKSTASRLLRILDNELDVYAWRHSLTSWERLKYSSPTSVIQNCPVFQRKAELDGEKAKKAKVKKPSPADRIKELEQENAHLQEENARHDGDWTDESAEMIADALKRRNQDKAEKVAEILHKPVTQPMRKVKGLRGFVSAWKAIREALKDAQALTPAERLEALQLIEHDLGEARAEAAPSEAPARVEAQTPQTPAKKPGFEDRRIAAAARANALDQHDLAERIKKIRYTRDMLEAENELDRIEAAAAL